MIDRFCEYKPCGRLFHPRPDQIRQGNGRFCSHRCARLEQPRESLEIRFWAKVDKSDGPDACWPWTAYRNPDGYGSIGTGGNKSERAHRVAYRLQVGKLAPDDHVLHKCDNPPCCNGSHLFIGNQADNVRDMVAKGRRRGPFGEDHPSAQLSETDVRTIIDDRASGVSVAEMVKRYGVRKQTIYNVLNGTTWRHLPR